MTTQIPDRLAYQDDEYLIISAKGNGLMSPSDFGMKAVTKSTACYRGYDAEYVCENENLFLTSIELRTGDGHFKNIDGVKPVIDERLNMGKYSALRVRTAFSGGLLIVMNMKKEMRGIMWPFSFEVVKELLLEEGKVVSATDHSKKVAAILDTLKRDRSISWNEIEWSFSQDYDMYYYISLAWSSEFSSK